MDKNLSVVLVFACAMLGALAYSPLGRAIGAGIRARFERGGQDPRVAEELVRLRHEVAELQERVDFAERLLARGSVAGTTPREG
ncbi:MAG TPA: hypothetical protein VLT17_00720 [Gemmatimonadales bacterium]|nr:hypothetical protein [Gemmatimonadales bacterium]